MRKLSTEQRAQILTALVEGNSMASTTRMFGASKITILRLLADAGTVARRYHDANVRCLESEHVQCDEIWAFVHCKRNNVPEHLRGMPGIGDTWTWTAIDADSKLMCDWYVGQRDSGAAYEFMKTLAPRFANRIQITTDGLYAYRNAMGTYFDVDTRCDYAQCIKDYVDEPGPRNKAPGKYSPGRVTSMEVKVCWGTPDTSRISTSNVERSNLTMRMGMRRFTRLTNGFSKKIENHRHAVALHFFHYNFIRKHQAIKTTPAVMAGVANEPWTMLDFVKMLEREEEMAGGRITDYKPAASKKNRADESESTT
jgi:IS1 family transposase